MRSVYIETDKATEVPTNRLSGVIDQYYPIDKRIYIDIYPASLYLLTQDFYVDFEIKPKERTIIVNYYVFKNKNTYNGFIDLVMSELEYQYFATGSSDYYHDIEYLVNLLIAGSTDKEGMVDQNQVLVCFEHAQYLLKKRLAAIHPTKVKV